MASKIGYSISVGSTFYSLSNSGRHKHGHFDIHPRLAHFFDKSWNYACGRVLPNDAAVVTEFGPSIPKDFLHSNLAVVNGGHLRQGGYFARAVRESGNLHDDVHRGENQLPDRLERQFCPRI